MFTHGELNEGHSQQHREQDGQSNSHHHDVPGHIYVIAKQQLRVHMSYEQEISREGYNENKYDIATISSYSEVCPCRLTIEGEVTKQCRDEVQQEAQADTDICNILHPALSGSERHEDTFTECDVYIAGKQQINYTVKVKEKLRIGSTHRSSSQ